MTQVRRLRKHSVTCRLTTAPDLVAQCREQVSRVLGDGFPEADIVHAIRRANYVAEQAISLLLDPRITSQYNCFVLPLTFLLLEVDAPAAGRQGELVCAIVISRNRDVLLTRACL